MDRHLEIALVSGALAALYGYALSERVRSQMEGRPIVAKSDSSLFWMVMVVLWLIEAGFVGLAFVSFVTWLDA